MLGMTSRSLVEVLPEAFLQQLQGLRHEFFLMTYLLLILLCGSPLSRRW